jgi:hypothetical protein
VIIKFTSTACKTSKTNKTVEAFCLWRGIPCDWLWAKRKFTYGSFSSAIAVGGGKLAFLRAG